MCSLAVFGLVSYMFPDLIHLPWSIELESREEPQLTTLLFRALCLCTDNVMCLARRHKEADVNQKLSGTRDPPAPGTVGGGEEKWPLKLGHFRKKECTVNAAADNGLILLTTKQMEWFWQRHKMEPDHHCSPLRREIGLSGQLIWSLTSLYSPWSRPLTQVHWLGLHSCYIWTDNRPATTDSSPRAPKYMKPYSVFTGRIRHLELVILMWFVAQGCKFIFLYFPALCSLSLLLSQHHKATSWIYGRRKHQAKYFPHIKTGSKQSSEIDKPSQESSLRASDWNDVLEAVGACGWCVRDRARLCVCLWFNCGECLRPRSSVCVTISEPGTVTVVDERSELSAASCNLTVFIGLSTDGDQAGTCCCSADQWQIGPSPSSRLCAAASSLHFMMLSVWPQL